MSQLEGGPSSSAVIDAAKEQVDHHVSSMLKTITQGGIALAAQGAPLLHTAGNEPISSARGLLSGGTALTSTATADASLALHDSHQYPTQLQPIAPVPGSSSMGSLAAPAFQHVSQYPAVQQNIGGVYQEAYNSQPANMNQNYNHYQW